MKIGIMQPYFFPYIGYFQLIDSVDLYVNLDHVSFMKRSYMVRNNLKNEYRINLQVNNGSQNRRCKDVTVNFDNKWSQKIESNVSSLYSKENNYQEIMDLIFMPCLYEENISVSDYNINSIIRICEYLNIDTKFKRSSEGMTEQKKGEGLKEICKKNDSYFYVNAIGGRSLYDKEDFKKSGIDLYFCKMDENIEFENPYSSILHLLFTYPKDHIKEQIKKYKLI